MKKCIIFYAFLFCLLPLASFAQDVRLAVQTGHSATITDLSYNSDGTLFASASLDNNVVIWHVESGKQYANLSGHQAGVTNIDFHASKNILYSSSLDSSVIVWDVATAKMIDKIQFNFPITALDVDEQNNRLLVAGIGLYVMDLTSKVKTRINIVSDFLFKTASFSKSGKWIAVSGPKEQFASVIHVKNNEVVGRIFCKANDIVFDEDEKSIYCGTEDGGITHYNFYNNEINGFTNKSEWNSFTGLRINDRRIFGTTDNGEVMVYSRISLSKQHILKAHLQSVKCIDVDPTGKYMITAGVGKRIILWDLKTMEMIKTFKSSIFRISQIAFSEDGREITMAFANGAVRKNDLFSNSAVSNRAKLSRVQLQNGWEFFLTGIEKDLDGESIFNMYLRRSASLKESGYDYLSHAKLLWDSYKNEVIVQETSTKSKTISTYEKAMKKGKTLPQSYFIDQSHTSDTKGNYSAHTAGGQLILKHVKTGAEIFNIDTEHTDKVTSVAINTINGFVATASWDGMVKFWSLKDGKLLTTYGAFGGSDFVYISPDNYYYASKGALDNIGFIYQGRIFSFDQFDLVYNRPDLVLKHLPYISDNLVNNYKRAYDKRLNKLGVAESDLGITLDIPSIEVTNVTGPVSLTGELVINVKANDNIQELEACHVLINGVPVFGKGGRLIRSNSSSFTENIRVNPGKNSVQVYVSNKYGVSSFKNTFTVVSKQTKVKSNLYVLSIGCSKYQQSEFNLNFAEKDATDITKHFKRSKEFDEVFLKKIVNEDVVWSSANDMKNFLKPANENDVVIVFIAGHGVLDDELDYFIASHDLDFNNPKENGIPIQFFDNLIDGVKSRKKLMFIDACHSGELDKTEYEVDTTLAMNEQGPDLVFRAVGNKVQKKDNVSAFELSKMAFADMRESNGSTVISSAGGAEYAMEGEEWSNGVFTYSLLKGLKTNAADLNRDKIIMVSELHAYLIRSVNEITNGRQTPTSRVENLSNDFRIE